jgi:hypothetical protein
LEYETIFPSVQPLTWTIFCGRNLSSLCFIDFSSQIICFLLSLGCVLRFFWYLKWSAKFYRHGYLGAKPIDPILKSAETGPSMNSSARTKDHWAKTYSSLRPISFWAYVVFHLLCCNGGIVTIVQVHREKNNNNVKRVSIFNQCTCAYKWIL